MNNVTFLKRLEIIITELTALYRDVGEDTPMLRASVTYAPYNSELKKMP